MEVDLSDWRTRIDIIDEMLIDLLNRRMQYALEAGRIKRANGQQIQDSEREKAIIDSLRDYNKGPLSNEAIVDIFTRIIEEARHLESEAE